MENRNQRLAEVTLLRKELHKYPSFRKEINTAKGYFFSRKLPS
jgi:hypothetical protein